jgi:galactokinase
VIASGLSADDAIARARLVEQAESGFARLSGTAGRWRWFVPGRLEVFGKHTDYAGGPTLVAAVPRGFAFVASPRADGIVRILDAGSDDRVELDTSGGAEAARGWRNYAATALRRLAANFPGARFGADISFISNLPRAAGLSSSSALMVGVATALVRRAGLEDRVEWHAAIASPEARAEYFSCLENGHTYRTLEGARGVGTQGGSEDHAAILMGKPGLLTQFGFIPVRRISDVPLPAAWRFVLASSGVHADKAGAMRGRYNRAASAARALTAIAAGAGIGAGVSLAAVVDSSADAADRLRGAIRVVRDPEHAPDDLVRRLAHFLNERGRVPEAAAAFAAADVARLSELALASQRDAEALLGNQVAETTSLVEAALEAGAPAASSFGAGFGGSAWALLTVEDAAPFGAAWLDTYLRRHPSRTAARWFTARPGPGLIEL